MKLRAHGSDCHGSLNRGLCNGCISLLQVYTGLILVNAGPMKYTLVHRISGFVSAMLNQVAHQQQCSNKEVIAVFQRQQETVLRVSKSTEECLQVTFTLLSSLFLPCYDQRGPVAYGRVPGERSILGS